MFELSDLRESYLIDEFDRRLTKLEDEASKSKKKDIWDKISAISVLASGIAIALFGWWATNVYDARSKAAEAAQKERATTASEIEAIGKLFPYVSSLDENTKQAALITLFATGNPSLSVKLAANFGGTGGRAALISIAQAPDPNPIRDQAILALGKLLLPQRDAVVHLEFLCNDETTPLMTDGFFVSATGYILAPLLGLKSCIEGPKLTRVSVKGISFLNSLGEANVVEIYKGLILLNLKSSTSPSFIKVASKTSLENGLPVVLVGSKNPGTDYADPYLETAVVRKTLAYGLVAIKAPSFGEAGTVVLSSSGEAVGIVTAKVITGHAEGDFAIAVGADAFVPLLRKHGLAD